ncbi:hypothetical protein TcCL_ESM11019 [Trypanosoma cruzi]|nr:hypothetical protein TcCL_ESM11019 [Trypanosoma cruzi]
MVALPFHISQYLGAMWDETAALLDLVAPFYRQLSWRICTGEFRLSSGICGSRGIDSPHTGHECCPEVPRTTARVLAEDPEMVRPQSVVPRVARRLLFGLAVSEPVGCGGVWFSGATVRSRSGANRRTGGPFQVV